MKAKDWKDVRRILGVRLDALGDVLMTTPALRALKELPSGPHLTLLTSPSGAALASLVPQIDDVISYSAPWMKATKLPDRNADLALISRLAEADYDAAVIFTVYSQSPWPAAFLCHLAGIPLRLAHGRENPYHLLTDWAVESEPHDSLRHEVVRQLDLVARIGAEPSDDRLQLAVPQAIREGMRARLEALDIAVKRPWVLIHPGASAASRRYSLEQYSEVAWRLAKRGLAIVLAGGPEEIDTVRAIARSSNGVCIAPPDLQSLAALISLAPVLVCNNSGPSHIAAAVGTPVVVLYALTNPQHAPWRVRSRVLFRTVPCAFCYKSVCPHDHHDCLRRVSPQEVVAAVMELL